MVNPGLGAALGAAGLSAAGNIGSTLLANYFQNKYMENWGGPEAQMARMKAAGINPYTAAGNVTGAAGDSAVGAQANLGAAVDAGIAAADSNINPTIKENTESESNKNNADASVSATNAEYNTKTMKARVQEAINNSDISSMEKERLFTYLQRYPEILDKDIQKITAEIGVAEKQVEVYDKQVEQMDAEIDNLREQKKLIISQTKYYNSAAELADANKALSEVNKRIAELEEQKAQRELDLFKSSGDLSGVVSEYMRIKKEEGYEAAERFLDEYAAAQEAIKRAESRGVVSGSNPLMMDAWKLHDRIGTSEEALSNTLAISRDLDIIAAQKAGDPSVSFEEYLEAQKAADEAKKEIWKFQARIKEAQKAFAKSMEFQGYKDPSKWYADNYNSLINTIISTGGHILGLYLGGRAVGRSRPVGTVVHEQGYVPSGPVNKTTRTDYQYGTTSTSSGQEVPGFFNPKY